MKYKSVNDLKTIALKDARLTLGRHVFRSASA